MLAASSRRLGGRRVDLDGGGLAGDQPDAFGDVIERDPHRHALRKANPGKNRIDLGEAGLVRRRPPLVHDHDSTVAERVLREATRRGFTEASRCVVLGDGSAWIWNTARELFPQATQILDRYHAKEALHRAAQSIFGATNEAKQWAAARCTELDAGKLHAVVHALLAHRTSHSAATKCAMYIFHNRPRMRYPKFHAQGLCTSTGVLEAGCKVAIGTRLKRAGMHWTVQGANAIIALRCCKLSGRFEDFWERRQDRTAA